MMVLEQRCQLFLILCLWNLKTTILDVFVEISQLVQSALDGYKVCIFAYGQTGSGKTYTMMGMPEALEKKGLIPRSLEQIFQTSQLLQAQGWKYKMQASMLEIYNETICDLLSVNRSSGLDLVRSENCGVGKQYAIKHDANGNTHVSDLTIVDASPYLSSSSGSIEGSFTFVSRRLADPKSRPFEVEVARFPLQMTKSEDVCNLKSCCSFSDSVTRL